MLRTTADIPGHEGSRRNTKGIAKLRVSCGQRRRLNYTGGDLMIGYDYAQWVSPIHVKERGMKRNHSASNNHKNQSTDKKIVAKESV